MSVAGKLYHAKEEARMDDLDRFLDEHPCKHCGGHYNDHEYLTFEEMGEVKEAGYVVERCEPYSSLKENRGLTWFCRLIKPPENPCDAEFMEEISS